MQDLKWDFPYRSQRMPVHAQNVVATSQALAAQAGLYILQQGGNAVDAAIATAMCLTVVEPCSNGLGSDAFAIIWDGNDLHGFNGSGRSPAAIDVERLCALDHMPKKGWDSITVPGAVDTWSQVSKRFGKLPFAQLAEQAIDYAEHGFPVSPMTAASWQGAQKTFKDFPDFQQCFAPQGRAPKCGEIFFSPDHAATLREIAQSHGESMYRGALAEKIVAASQTGGGAFSLDDLAQHSGFWVEPIRQEYHGVELCEIPPNGQGIAALIALGILRHCQITEYAVDSLDFFHLQIEAMKIAFAETFRHLSDPQHMHWSTEQLLDEEFLQQRAAEISMDEAKHPQAAFPLDAGTVYMSTADENGMMVSFIQSNFMGFGSGIVIPDTGIAMQNRGCGFSCDPRHPNCVAGGKLPYHTIIPGFIMQNNQPLMSFGVMGGHMQAQGHVQMVVRMTDFGQNPQTALDAPRWHISEDFTLQVENNFPADLVQGLKDRGHHLNEKSVFFGGGQIVLRQVDAYCAASDHRRDGQAVGF